MDPQKIEKWSLVVPTMIKTFLHFHHAVPNMNFRNVLVPWKQRHLQVKKSSLHLTWLSLILLLSALMWQTHGLGMLQAMPPFLLNSTCLQQTLFQVITVMVPVERTPDPDVMTKHTIVGVNSGNRLYLLQLWRVTANRRHCLHCVTGHSRKGQILSLPHCTDRGQKLNRAAVLSWRTNNLNLQLEHTC